MVNEMPTEYTRTIFFRPMIPEGPSTLVLSATAPEGVVPIFLRIAPSQACMGAEVQGVEINGVRQQLGPVTMLAFADPITPPATRGCLPVFNTDGPDHDLSDGAPVGWAAFDARQLLHIDLRAQTPQRPRWALTVRTTAAVFDAYWQIDCGARNQEAGQAMVVDYATRRRLSGPEAV